jgi:hypothetical protein
MDIHLATIRRDNLRRLLSKYGSQKELARVSGLVPAHISQMLGGKRNVGNGAATRIEQRLELAAGWMDCSEPITDGQKFKSITAPQVKNWEADRLTARSGAPGSGEVACDSDEVCIDPVVRNVLAQLENHGKTYENIRLDGLVNSLFGIFRVGVLVDNLAIDIFHISSTNEQPIIDRVLARLLKMRHATPRLAYIVILSPIEGQAANSDDRWNSLVVPRLNSVLEAAVSKEGLIGFAVLASAQDAVSIENLVTIALH